MSSLSGFRFDITGASGSQGLLTPKSGWRAYVLPRGGHAAQDSTGTLITFDSEQVADRFAADDWIQVGLSVANIRQVSGVGGDSISVAGDAVVVSENDRVFLIGTTQPTVVGGSATYTVPATKVHQRDDDQSDLYVNSMITSNADGMVQGFAAANFYDCLVQDGDQSLQGSLVDLTVGVVEGVSVSVDALFGGSLTVNGAFGVTGWATFGSSVTMNGALGVTGHASFADSVAVDGAFGVSGTATFAGPLVAGVTSTVNGALGVTGTATFGSTVAVNANVTSNGSATFSGQPLGRVTNSSNTNLLANNTLTIVGWSNIQENVGGMVDFAGSSSFITVPESGTYLVSCLVQWAGNTAGSRKLSVFDHQNGVLARHEMAPANGNSLSETQSICICTTLAAGNTLSVHGIQNSGAALAMGFGSFQAVKLH